MAYETIPDPTITYTKYDQQIWDEDLEDFVPERIFDAHTHLWTDEHLSADDPKRGEMMVSDMPNMVRWNERIFPNRQIEYLVLGTPRQGIDVDGHNSWLHEQMQGMFNKVTRISSKQGTVYIARKTSPLKKIKDFTCEFAFRDQGNLIKAVSRPGVFSHRRLDAGARALLNVIEVRDGDRVLDMGCGSGAVGLAAAARNSSVSVTAIDSNARAVSCTEQGAKLNELSNITTVHTAVGECAGQGTFDLFLGNPPYFSNYRIAELFLKTAAKMLKPGGEVLIVCKKMEWYQERMAKFFDGVGFAKSGAYNIIGGVQRGERRKRD